MSFDRYIIKAAYYDHTMVIFILTKERWDNCKSLSEEFDWDKIHGGLHDDDGAGEQFEDIECRFSDKSAKALCKNKNYKIIEKTQILVPH